MQTVGEFEREYPHYAFDFSALMRTQLRVYSSSELGSLPVELQAIAPYTKGGRGRPNRNQTRTHHQCATCHRVLRNDYFWLADSTMRQNIVHTHCIACAKVSNDERYDAGAERLRLRRMAIWTYLAPECAICGFNRHPAAMDMHHVGEKEALVSGLIAKLAAAPLDHNARKILDEASHCIPLCSNCHRLVHASVLRLPEEYHARKYDIEELLTILHKTKLGGNG